MLSATAIIQTVLKMLKEPTDGSGHYTQAEVLERLNMCQDRVSLRIPDLLRDEDTSLATVTNQANYTLPSDVGKIISIRVDGKPLDATTEETLDRDSQRGMIMEKWKTDESGEPTQYYTRKGVLYLFPKPSSAYNAKAITILHELLLTELTNITTSYPFENISYLKRGQELLIFATVEWLAMEDGNTKLEASMARKFNEGIGALWTDVMVLKETRPESLMKEKGNENSEDGEDSSGIYEYK